MAETPKNDQLEPETTGYEIKTNENGEEVIEIPVEDLQEEGVEKIDRIELIPESSEKDDSQKKLVVSQKREDTRGRLALFYLLGFFIIMIGVSILSFFADTVEGTNQIDTLREAILVVSGVLSGPLGFIIGFYFRKAEEE